MATLVPLNATSVPDARGTAALALARGRTDGVEAGPQAVSDTRS